MNHHKDHGEFLEAATARLNDELRAVPCPEHGTVGSIALILDGDKRALKIATCCDAQRNLVGGLLGTFGTAE